MCDNKDYGMTTKGEILNLIQYENKVINDAHFNFEFTSTNLLTNLKSSLSSSF